MIPSSVVFLYPGVPSSCAADETSQNVQNNSNSQWSLGLPVIIPQLNFN